MYLHNHLPSLLSQRLQQIFQMSLQTTGMMMMLCEAVLVLSWLIIPARIGKY